MADDRPHLLYFYDAAFASCTRVSLVTALAATPGALRVTLHPTEDDPALTDDLAALARYFPQAETAVQHIDLTPFSDLPRGRLPLAARARLLMPEVHRGRVIYLDGDTVVRHDLTPLWQEDLGGASLGAALAPGVHIRRARAEGGGRGADEARAYLAKRSADLGGIDLSRYFNNGVMVIDLDRMRENGQAARMADLRATARYNHRDQSYMNAIFNEDLHVIDPTWNSGWGNPRTDEGYLPADMRAAYRASREDPAIVHYTGFEKPWQAPRPPFKLHLSIKPRQRKARARWWAEFQTARARTEAILGRRLAF